MHNKTILKMKKLIVLVLIIGCTKINTVWHFKAASKTTCKSLPLIFLFGQSNQLGGDPDTSATPDFCKGKINNAFVFYHGQIQTLEYGVNNSDSAPARYFGAETGIGYYLCTVAGKRVGIIKFAIGGSRLVDTKYISTGNWQIDADSTDGRRLYKEAIERFAYPGFDTFKVHGYNPYVLGFCWMQGENDAGDSVAAPRYKKELNRLLNKFKYDMRSRDSGVNNMNVIIVRISSHLFNKPYLSQVRAAQVKVGTDYPDAHWVDSDTWPKIHDSTHYTRLSQATLHAKAIADILNQYIQ